ncbi:hypothetical protein ACFPM3_30595 [Streptomyces coeruleoprunus]|uniref:Uncharacterized protein n=1 Tax=Streptomyces coeruleoprunus TaxID=285563 RepID=A0ABV9XM79_9ACTN
MVLVVTRTCGGRIWRLADTCAACAAAIPDAAVVPDTLTSHVSDMQTPGRGRIRRRLRTDTPHRESKQTHVRNMLSYLAVALPSTVSSEARLVALQSALRCSGSGEVHMARGLMRAMRLLGACAVWQELHDARWLCLEPLARHSGAPVTARLLDAAVLTQAPGRLERAQAADWALRTAHCPAVRRFSARVRLAALALAAHTAEGSCGGEEEAERLGRVAGLDIDGLLPVLEELLDAGVVVSWRLVQDGDVQWVLAQGTQ